jgi:hypothetical protein
MQICFYGSRDQLPKQSWSAISCLFWESREGQQQPIIQQCNGLTGKFNWMLMEILAFCVNHHHDDCMIRNHGKHQIDWGLQDVMETMQARWFMSNKLGFTFNIFVHYSFSPSCPSLLNPPFKPPSLYSQTKPNQTLWLLPFLKASFASLGPFSGSLF